MPTPAKNHPWKLARGIILERAKKESLARQRRLRQRELYDARSVIASRNSYRRRHGIPLDAPVIGSSPYSKTAKPDRVCAVPDLPVR